jgi:hypothetical protein
MKKKKRTSEKQIEANRGNARKSTGPKTQEGRAVSSRNAVKHGILSAEVVVQGSVIDESPREYRALHRRFWEHFAPEGPLEEMLVDQIVTTQWRLRRVLRAEAGEIALSVDEGYQKRNPRDPVVQWLFWGVSLDPAREMRETSLGTAMLIMRLRQVREAVEKEGKLTEAAIALAEVGRKPNTITHQLNELRKSFMEAAGESEADDMLRTSQKEEALRQIDLKLNQLAYEERECREREEIAEAASRAATLLPSVEVLEKITRYETKLRRQLARDLNQLERIQRMRRGEDVPAPMTMAIV